MGTLSVHRISVDFRCPLEDLDLGLHSSRSLFLRKTRDTSVVTLVVTPLPVTELCRVSPGT